MAINDPYNLSSLTAETGIYGFMNAANDLSGGLFGTLILVVVFIIMVMTWRNYEPKVSISVASFITALISIFLRILQWIPDATMFACFIIAGIGFALLKWA